MIGLTKKDNELRMQVGFTLTHEANHQLIASEKDGNWKCPMETLGELLELVRQDEREICADSVFKMAQRPEFDAAWVVLHKAQAAIRSRK